MRDHANQPDVAARMRFEHGMFVYESEVHVEL